jgi:K+-transporting ATPase, KdpA
MNYFDIIQLVLYIGGLVILAPVIGKFMADVFENKPFRGKKLFAWAEKRIYRYCGINPEKAMDWKMYAFALLIFNLAGFLVVFILQLFQQHLGLNPQHQKSVEETLAFNTAVSFMTNTNWQSYSGENTMSYLTQMLGFTVQNFVSAATGITVLLALIRGLRNRTSENLGNFFSDLTRSVIYILLPLSIIFAVVLVGQGVVQNFSHYQETTTLEGAKQLIPLGPAASQIAIKQLGTNGGGFFGANSAHPFENPTPLTNFLEMLAILLIPAGLTFTYGRMVGSVRQGWILFATMFILFIVGLGISTYSEFSFAGHLMEGKETRIGIMNSILWENVTTAASNGSVNAMHSSLSPLAGMVGLFNMMLGEIIFGGVGAGLYGMLIFVILTVFIAGLMVGRTPEYLGKKIEAFEMKMAIIGVVLPSFVILGFTAVSVLFPFGLESIAHKGPHGFSEVLYNFTSVGGNNGSAFACMNTNTPYYNIIMAIGMLIGRFGVILPVLAIAGSLSRKKIVPVSAGTFQTDNMTFVFLLISIILIVGALTFFPALSLGPIIEHILMLTGKSF